MTESHPILPSDSDTLVKVEGVSKKDPNHMQARTANNRVVNFVGNPRLIHQMVDIEITESFTFSLRGNLVINAD